MANTDDNGAGAPSSQPDWTKAAKRYGPIAAVVALVIGAIAVFGGGGGDDGDDGPTDAATSGDELILSGPMTPQRAELEGEDPDFGPNCDTDTGRIKLVSIYAPPCVVPFEGDNGGATYAGVTEDEIKVVYYASDPALDPLTAATISSAGANVNPETAAETVAGFVGLYNALFETYGRTVVVEAYTGTGAGDDVEAARADAIAIAEMEPFAVIGGPQQASPVFASELASKGIVCGPSCATALPEEIVEEYEPYIWQAGPTPDQAASLAATLPHPLTSNPARNPGRMAWRRDMILRRMGGTGPVETVPLAPASVDVDEPGIIGEAVEPDTPRAEPADTTLTGEPAAPPSVDSVPPYEPRDTTPG